MFEQTELLNKKGGYFDYNWHITERCKYGDYDQDSQDPSALRNIFGEVWEPNESFADDSGMFVLAEDDTASATCRFRLQAHMTNWNQQKALGRVQVKLGQNSQGNYKYTFQIGGETSELKLWGGGVSPIFCRSHALRAFS